jgi:hypothetical protein
VCLHEGRVVADDESDALRERFAEWIVTSHAGRLPAHFDEPFVVSAQGDANCAHLLVCDVAAADIARFEASRDAKIEVRPLTLEQVFPLLTGRKTVRGPHRGTAQRGGASQ